MHSLLVTFIKCLFMKSQLLKCHCTLLLFFFFVFSPTRKKYTTFRSKCWRHVTKKCYNDKACLETLIKDDMPCSANADCKAAYISNWDTMLHMECTCQNLPLVEQPLCELFHHMLHSKSCFSDLRE